MPEWMAQWYANVPAFANVCEKVAFDASDLLSNEPSSAVTVWAVAPVLVHVTLLPTLTVTVPGSKPKSMIFAGVPPPAAADAAPDAGAPEAVAPPGPPATAATNQTPPTP